MSQHTLNFKSAQQFEDLQTDVQLIPTPLSVASRTVEAPLDRCPRAIFVSCLLGAAAIRLHRAEDVHPNPQRLRPAPPHLPPLVPAGDTTRDIGGSSNIHSNPATPG